MPALYYAHSGLRYLVLALGLFSLVVFAAGWFGRRPYGRLARIAGASFAGTVHLQILLGLGLVLTGIWYPALAGHLALMLAAAVVVTAAAARARRASDARRAYAVALGGVLLALLLIVGGIAAIGRGVLESRAGEVATVAEP